MTDFHPGARFGLLTLLEKLPVAREQHSRWLCSCDCGRRLVAYSNDLRRTPKCGTKSCGCLRQLNSYAAIVRAGRRPRSVTDPDVLRERLVAKLRTEPEPEHVRGLGACLVWTGNARTEGYGQMSVGGKQVSTHRLAWFLEHGSWPELYVLHKCDNPPCCNTSHLFLGTHADNMADMVAKGRNGRPHSRRGAIAALTRKP